MSSANSNDVLNRLSVIHNRSLPMYLGYAPPFYQRAKHEARQVLALIVDYQREIVDRIGSLIVDRNGTVDSGAFPMYFTGYHDLSVEFLITKVIELLLIDVTNIQACVDDLGNDPVAKAIAEEALGAAKGHLDTLQELS